MSTESLVYHRSKDVASKVFDLTNTASLTHGIVGWLHEGEKTFSEHLYFIPEIGETGVASFVPESQYRSQMKARKRRHQHLFATSLQYRKERVQRNKGNHRMTEGRGMACMQPYAS